MDLFLGMDRISLVLNVSTLQFIESLLGKNDQPVRILLLRAKSGPSHCPKFAMINAEDSVQFILKIAGYDTLVYIYMYNVTFTYHPTERMH